MKVWIILTGMCNGSGDEIHGVYSSKEKAEEELNKIDNLPDEYKYIEEQEVE